jgi:hypothetical protein
VWFNPSSIFGGFSDPSLAALQLLSERTLGYYIPVYENNGKKWGSAGAKDVSKILNSMIIENLNRISNPFLLTIEGKIFVVLLKTKGLLFKQ